MISRSRFIKSIRQLKSMIKKDDCKKIGYNISISRGDYYIEVNIFSVEETIDDDMWDMEITWDELDKRVRLTSFGIFNKNFQWYHLDNDFSELLDNHIFPSTLKEWIIYNMDLFINK